MLAMGSILPTLLLVGLCFMPESPRWLLANERNLEAQQILEKIHEDGTDCDEMVRGIRDVIVAEADAARSDEGGSSGWTAIFWPTRPVFYALLAAVGIAAIQQVTDLSSPTQTQTFLLSNHPTCEFVFLCSCRALKRLRTISCSYSRKQG